MPGASMTVSWRVWRQAKGRGGCTVRWQVIVVVQVLVLYQVS